MDEKKAFQQMVASRFKMADETKTKAIGDKVLFLIERDGEISVQALITALQDTVDSFSPTAQYDLSRLQAEAALVHLKARLEIPK
ncbi:MAG: hypothetical protein AB7D06_17015 [Pedobacter sp.]